jgi:hypothetical protein
MPEKPIVCPKCGQFDAIRKVSSIVAEGTTFTENSGLGMAFSKKDVQFFDALGPSYSRSGLASALSRPQKPSEPSDQGCIRTLLLTRVGCTLIILTMIAAAGVCSFPFLYSTYRENPILFLIPFVAFVVVGIVLTRWILLSLRRETRTTSQKQTEYPVQLQNWERAIQRWEHLYYCYRDDGVFLPLQPRLVPLIDMQSFLYAADKKKRQI